MGQELARGRVGRAAGRALGLDGVVAAVAPRVAAQQPPAGEHEPAQYAVALDRLHARRPSRSARTCSAAAAAAREPLVERGSGRRDARAGASRVPASPRRRPARRARRARARTPARPSRSASSRASGRATTTKSWPAGSALGLGPEGLAQQALDRLRSTAPPTLRDTDRPRRGPSLGVRRPRAGRREHEVAVRRASGPAGRRARTRRCATAAAAWPRGDAAVTRRRHGSDGQPLAALVAAALERQAAGARAHARAEPVGAGALALLGLVGALHRDRVADASDTAREYTRGSCTPACTRRAQPSAGPAERSSRFASARDRTRRGGPVLARCYSRAPRRAPRRLLSELSRTCSARSRSALP